MLTPRRIEIFKAIVDEYIRTAEPVGSKTLQQKYHLDYSSATIRNDMQVLEELGYLEKTHTSSGRIPSTLGYKFYCEHLLDGARIDKKMEVAIRNAFDTMNMNLDDAVHQSCQILSEMTNMTTGAIGPDSSSQRLQHIKLFAIDQRNIVSVIITNTGHTETKNFHFDEDIPFADLEACMDIINQRLQGTKISELAIAMESIKPDLTANVQRHELLFTAFVKAFVRFANENVYFSGKDRMLYQPEFSDINRLKQLMTMFNDSSVWKTMADENSVALTTPSGSTLTWHEDLAVIRSKFHINADETGELMVVGPSRMNYEKIVSLIEYAAKTIEHMYYIGGKKSDE